MRMHRSRGNSGMTIVEVIAALGLLLAAAGAFAQLHWLAARQQRSAETREAASMVLANWMERCAQVPFGELSEERLTSLANLEPLKDRLPDAEAVASVVVEEEEDTPSGKRVTVSLRWPAADDAGTEAVQLVAWRYAPPASEAGQ